MLLVDDTLDAPDTVSTSDDDQLTDLKWMSC